ncbi:MAG: RING finger protein [Candidatus Woesearchaeota archaeon]
MSDAVLVDNIEEVKCPVCGDLLGDEEITRCPLCDTPHHKECWEYTGKCAVYNCRDGAFTPVVSEKVDVEVEHYTPSIWEMSRLFLQDALKFVHEASMGLVCGFISCWFQSILILFATSAMPFVKDYLSKKTYDSTSTGCFFSGMGYMIGVISFSIFVVASMGSYMLPLLTAHPYLCLTPLITQTLAFIPWLILRQIPAMKQRLIEEKKQRELA